MNPVFAVAGFLDSDDTRRIISDEHADDWMHRRDRARLSHCIKQRAVVLEGGVRNAATLSIRLLLAYLLELIMHGSLLSCGIGPDETCILATLFLIHEWELAITHGVVTDCTALVYEVESEPMLMIVMALVAMIVRVVIVVRLLVARNIIHARAALCVGIELDDV